jgi:hypothetical protein
MIHDNTEVDKVNFWHNVLTAVRTEPLTLTQLRGGSGLQHDVIAVGIHEGEKRLVLVSEEHDGRSTALVQADIQAAYSNYHVLSIRPAVVSIPKVAEAIQAAFGSTFLSKEFLEAIKRDTSLIKNLIEPNLKHLGTLVKSVSIRPLPQWLELIQQLARLDIRLVDVATGDHSVDLTNVIAYDPIAADRTVGVCGFPLYEFSVEDINLIASSPSPEEVAECLKSRNIFQYFFPGADQLALGLVDRGIRRVDDIRNEIIRAPDLGHPLGEMEIVDKNADMLDVIDALRSRNMLVEGELGLDISDKGKSARCQIKFTPKEGVISRFFSRLSLKELAGIFLRKKGD